MITPYISKIKFYFISFAIAGAIAVSFSFANYDEGQYPVNQIQKVDLQKAGIQLSAEQIFSEKGGALSDALVRLGGCTGSFISEQGMIITNHHCVFGSVSRLSTEENNYLRDGFYADRNEAELHTGLPAKITISSEDVSAQVLSGLEGKEGKERDKTLRNNIKSVIANANKSDSSYTYEVSEMFLGKQYFLFKYIILKDVRLVYVPPRYIGEFGAETDNWEWPRHTGDFSVVRAYVGKDGKPAAYSKDNVPFNPNRHLKINPEGTKENDAVFILGYPGRTYRHQPYEFLNFQYKTFMPTVVEWFNWRIDKMHDLSKGNTTRYLKFAGTIKSLANVEKNFRGKIQGLTRTSVLQDKMALDASIEAMSNGSSYASKYSKVMPGIAAIYNQRNQYYELDFYISRVLRDVGTVGAAMHAYEQRGNEELRFNQFSLFYGSQDVELEVESLHFLIDKINALAEQKGMLKLKITNYSKEKWRKCFQNSRFTDYLADVKPLVESKSAKLINKKDPLYALCEELLPLVKASRERAASFKKENDLLMPKYTELKMAYLKTDFIPDANSTMRFTYGRVKGFSPNDGEYHYPHTSLTGVLEKANSEEDYYMPQDAIDIYRRDNVSKMLLDPKTGKVTVGLLYNLDTTGGNSGSPVLDANGDLVGINFDRAYTATINDYAWNEKYSRSIGVDIRYVLYVMKYIGKADRVLDELKIKL